MAEEVGFEPTVRYKRTLVFKTSAISQTLPFFRYLVRVERFELPTLWSQTRCATRLRYTRLLVGAEGNDPSTPVLSGQCSTSELCAKNSFNSQGLLPHLFLMSAESIAAGVFSSSSVSNRILPNVSSTTSHSQPHYLLAVLRQGLSSLVHAEVIDLFLQAIMVNPLGLEPRINRLKVCCFSH